MVTAEQVEDFGPWLGRQLRRVGMTQTELANQLGVTRAAVSAWITGRAEPRDETKRGIAVALGAEPAAVYNRTDDIVPAQKVEWYHRRAHPDGGREFGNAAAFAFKADLTVLAREATQNSLDEREDDSRPVRVRYTLHELSGENLESFLSAVQWEHLQAHYRAAAASGQKVARSLETALQSLLERRALTILRIDDYNAAGLTGPEYEDGRFAAVVRRQLDSHKKAGGRAGGSYGLGKATLWATSRLGLVLINSNLSQPYEGRTRGRVIGRLELPWREVDGEAYAGPAWLGEPDTDPEHKDIARSWWADEATLRALHLERPGDDPGTSFLIVDVHDLSGNEDADSLQGMHANLVDSLADAFWAAMVSGGGAGPLLEASVTALRNGSVVLPEERVDPHRRHPALSRALKAYFDGETVTELTAHHQVARVGIPLDVPERKSTTTRPGGPAGRHEAVLLITPSAEGDTDVNRVVCMRGNRMTIMERRPRDLPLGADPFQAVLLAGFATGRDDHETELAEEFLRAAEPPEHNRWDRTAELVTGYQRGAVTRLSEFKSAIDTAVRELVGRRERRESIGPAALKELLKLDGPSSVAARRAPSYPTVQSVDARIDDSGAWRVTVSLRVPPSEDPWRLTPIAKFDVRSGGRPSVEWAELTAVENCAIDGGDLLIEAKARTARFAAVTDVSSHPVAGAMVRLGIDVQQAGRAAG
jgi:transcriptional regulator with XRE-family HTH domain